MINWTIEENGFNKENIPGLGNRFLSGNGYLGIRGTVAEYEKEQFTAINLAGIYDQVGNGWREPLNAPNGLYTAISFEDTAYALPVNNPKFHTMKLNYRHGIFSRKTIWDIPNGELKVEEERFASFEEKHLIAMKYSLTSTVNGTVTIRSGIDGAVWDINGPHYDVIQLDNILEDFTAIGVTHENQDKVVVCETMQAVSQENQEYIERAEISNLDNKIIRELKLNVKANVTYSFYKYITVYTSKDTNECKDAALTLLHKAKQSGYVRNKEMHVVEWENKWQISEVFIEGDDEAMESLNYSLYHLHSIAPRHANSLSIAARGLSGQTYKGAVFWDTEMFMLDFFLFTEPNVAKTLLKYRIDTLEGAINKAKAYGFEGAFYPWESQEGGYDACSDYNVTDVFTGRPMRTYFKDKQIHISSAIVYGIMRYIDYTGNEDLLREGGAKVIIECAKFYESLLVKRVNVDRYELWDVIGPDEYHERVNNNAYTNRMAKYTFDSANKVINSVIEDLNEYEGLQDIYNLGELQNRFTKASENLYIPSPDKETRIIEQFDGYSHLEDVTLSDLKTRILNEKEYWGGAYGIASHTKIIKQADVITMLNLFSKDYKEEELLKNFSYYEPRTEHGSSLSACMYSMLACKCNMPDKAYPFFIKSAKADLSDGGKQWAGLIYIGGTHPAASGGAYMTAIEGFAGIHIENGKLMASPVLPDKWKELSFKMYFHGNLYGITVTKESANIQQLNMKSVS